MDGTTTLWEEMSMRFRVASGAALVCALFLAVACGDEGGGGESAGSTAPVVKGAKAIDVSLLDKPASGTVTYCTGKDTTGAKTKSVADFNQRFASEGLRAKLLEFSTSADEQRTQFVQRAEARSPECDVFFSDVIWTAEFASQNWVYDVTQYVQKRRAEFIRSTLETAHYGNRYWGVPKDTNAAFLFYRSDQVETPPQTWQQVYADANAKNGIVYQGAPYEGLTCDFLELAFAAGGQVISADGKKAVIDSPQNLKALQFMVAGIKDKTAANGVTTYMEEESRRYWESGKATYMRNWPYAYALGQMKHSKVADKFAVAAFPRFEDGGTAGILGGGNLVISVSSKNPGGALKLVDFLTQPDQERQDAAKFSVPPVLAATYDDPAVKKALPFAAELKQAVAQAKPRPVSPVYPQISQAIYKNVNEALTGRATPESALKRAQAEMQKALATF
jgi:trehalose/maltose transport system substrate-binding protein